jgi:phage terminase large subunit
LAALTPTRTFDVQFTFYGGAREFVRYHGPECLCHGPAETGKTISALWTLHLCALKYPGASIVIARKTLSSAYSTVLQTFMGKVLGDRDTWPCEPYGGEKPEWFNYPNGARIWLAGLDKSSKTLSAEHDLVYVNQAEELELEDWETLTTRTTGRAGNMPYSQTIGDANPSYPMHWMYKRPSLRLFYSIHRDNPALYDPITGAITEQGQRTMTVLEALTGTRRTRLLEGKPAQAEGVIYEEWNEATHLIYADALPVLTRYVAGQDWGFTHPGVLGVWGMDGDGRAYLVAQVYRTKQTVDWWVERALELHREYRLEVIACGPDQPAYIQTYRQAGLNAVAADNAVLPGINAVQQRLKAAEDGRPRLFVVRDSLRYPDQDLIAARQPHKVEDEFPGYVWSDSKSKEIPVKDRDDGMDMTRYAAMYMTRPVRAKVVTIDYEQ